MKPVVVTNGNRGTVLLAEGRMAVHWKERLAGLMGRKILGAEEGLVIRPCESIHTHWMRMPIDVVFIDVEGVAVRVFPNVKPWRMRFGGGRADTVIEGPVGMIGRSGTEPGDRIRIDPPTSS
ncbi:MAG: DUF192 domain-containing protein [Candidatus Eisenbacteria bacterium]